MKSYVRASLVLEGVAVLLVVWLGIGHRLALSPGRPLVIAQRIDPNTACAASLERLPNIGPQRAGAILAYRSRLGANERAFHSPEDLQQVPGIGPKTVESLQSWLSFAGPETDP